MTVQIIGWIICMIGFAWESRRLWKRPVVVEPETPVEVHITIGGDKFWWAVQLLDVKKTDAAVKALRLAAFELEKKRDEQEMYEIVKLSL